MKASKIRVVQFHGYGFEAISSNRRIAAVVSSGLSSVQKCPPLIYRTSTAEALGIYSLAFS